MRRLALLLSMLVASGALAQDSAVLVLVTRLDASGCATGGTAVVDVVVYAASGPTERERTNLAVSCADVVLLHEGALVTATSSGSSLAQVTLAGPADYPTIDARAVLGQPIATIDARYRALDPPASGWTRWYAVGFGVLEGGGVVQALILPIPAGATCGEVAAQAGFPDAAPAIRREGGCQWPGLSDRHSIGAGLGAFATDGFLVVGLGPLS